ncbi:uncharacterized protein LOC136092350 [Hydra vulgaris]|uniref:Uncharacterized protein LOC136092350 n=1 Tax=Hydra vulgaris TaxID=6087 RepID=A0ABM4DPE1_HYDVU
MIRDRGKKEKKNYHNECAAKCKILKEISESECSTETKNQTNKHNNKLCSCRSCIGNLYTTSGRMVVIPSPALVNNDSHLETTETSEKQFLNKRNLKKKSRSHRSEKKELNQTRHNTFHLQNGLNANCNKKREMKKNKLKSVDPCCPLCTKPFICPILLPCAHTFCKDCVTVFVETSDGKKFSCPVCTTDISLMGSDEELFCPNFIILKTIESDECDSNLCSVCDLNQEARYFCEECSDLLCHECKERHRVVKNTKKHEVKRITSDTDIPNVVKKRYFCSEHEKEQLLLHCLYCQQSVCRECALVNHYGDKHNCIPIVEAAKRYREVLRRNLYSLKSRSPNLQLSLMDVKRVKKLLKDQVRSVRKEVGESIKRILKNVKEKEQALYQNLVQAYRIKAKSLNKHRDTILIELEQFEAASRLLQQLEHHENNVEMLQMKTTIDKTLTNLEKPGYSFNLEQETLMFRSSEKEILAAIDRHGEIFRFCNKHKKETLNDMFCKHTVKNNSAKESSYIIICDFNTALSPPVWNFKDETGDMSNDRRDRARNHWRILRLRLNEIIGNFKNIRPQINESINLINDSLFKGVGKYKDFSLKPITPLSINKSNSEHDIKNIKVDKVFVVPNSLEMQSKTERAYSNWLLVQSKIYDIIDYGRMKGLISFNSRNTSLKSNRRRENRFILKVRRYRAKTLRARANWKILISKVSYKNHKNYYRSSISFLDDYRKDLIQTKQKAACNKTIAGKVRASANWLLVKARIKDIILIERHTTPLNTYKSNTIVQSTNSIQTKVTPTLSGENVKPGLTLTSLKSIKHDSNPKLDSKKKEIEKKQIFKAKLDQLSSSLDRLSFETFDVNSAIEQKSFFLLNQSKSFNCLNTDSLNNCDLLMKKNVSKEYTESSPVKLKEKLSKSMLNISETSKNLTECNNWDFLIKNGKSNEFLEITPIKTCAKPPKVKSKIPRPKRNSYESTEKEPNKNILKQQKSNENITTLKKSCQSNIPISSKSKNVRDRDKISNSAPNLSNSSYNDNIALENWINLIEKADALSLVADKEAFENWKLFFNSNKKTKNTLSESKEKEALKNWYEILKDPTSKEALQNWGEFLKDPTSKEALKNWHEFLKDPTSIEALKHWDEFLKDPTSKEALKHWDEFLKDPTSKEALKHWDEFLKDPTSKEALKHWDEFLKDPTSKEALKHWDEFLKDPTSKEALKRWDALLKDATSKNIIEKESNYKDGNTKKNNSTSSNKINNLEMADDTQTFLYWEKLIEGKIIRDNPSPNQESNLEKNFNEPNDKDCRLKSPSASTSSIKSKSSSVYKFIKQRITSRKSLNNKIDTPDNVIHSKDGRIIQMNVKDSNNVFQELQVKLTSPDATILSTHVTKNSDGTFTVYCCPSIDNDFRMVVTINCEQFTKQHQVFNIHGSFATMKKKERDLACKTISLFRWHLTPGLLTKRGDKVIARVVRKA